MHSLLDCGKLTRLCRVPILADAVAAFQSFEVRTVVDKIVIKIKD